MEPVTHTKGEYTISTDKSKLDIKSIHAFLTNAYWSKGIPYQKVEKSIEHALCFGVYHHEAQVGFARIISDFSAIAYLGDVYIEADHRGQGLAKWLMRCILSHPELQGLRRWILATKDAHGLYAQFGFEPLSNPERYMQIWNPNIYENF